MFENFNQNNSFFTQNFRQEFRKGEILSQIIGINVFIFLLITISGIFFFLGGIRENPLVKILSFPSNFQTFIRHPWGVLTYMFTHQGLFHLLFNMIWLYWIGRLFIKFFGIQKLLGIYIFGGIGGAVLYMLAYNYFIVFVDSYLFSYTIGASASIMAIFFAVATYAPNSSIHLLFIGRIKMLHFALAFIIIDLLMIQGENAGGHISHIGGALVGIIFALLAKQNLFIKGNTEKNKYQYNKDYSYNTQKKNEEENINHILDKISKSGYESLTVEERKTLFKSSYKK